MQGALTTIQNAKKAKALSEETHHSLIWEMTWDMNIVRIATILIIGQFIILVRITISISTERRYTRSQLFNATNTEGPSELSLTLET
jgi:hypothetical protein